MKDYMVQAEKIKKRLHEEGIHSTTIQPEFVEFKDEDEISTSIHSSEDCILDCPSADKDGCAANTCCGANKQVNTTKKNESSNSDDIFVSVESATVFPNQVVQKNNSQTHQNEIDCSCVRPADVEMGLVTNDVVPISNRAGDDLSSSCVNEENYNSNSVHL